MVGKTIGVISVGGLSEALLDITMIRDGKQPGDSKRVVTGNSPGEIELVKQGRIDCFICNFQTALTLERSGQDLVFLDIDKVVPAEGGVYYTPRALIETKPDVVQRVIRAMKASVDEIIAGPMAPIYERAGKDFEIPRIKDIDTLVAVQEQYVKRIWLAEGKENLLRNVPKLWEQGLAGMREVGIVKDTDPTHYYTNQFVDSLTKS
jgi:ABC-type nitrate/sulfonate/bicarbonate transport system substrate-binding protein